MRQSYKAFENDLFRIYVLIAWLKVLLLQGNEEDSFKWWLFSQHYSSLGLVCPFLDKPGNEISFFIISLLSQRNLYGSSVILVALKGRRDFKDVFCLLGYHFRNWGKMAGNRSGR